MDASMCMALMHLSEHLKKKEKMLFISGITQELWTFMQRAKLLEKIGEDHLFLTDETRPQLSTWVAYQRAERELE
jgi:hypothetical protein